MRDETKFRLEQVIQSCIQNMGTAARSTELYLFIRMWSYQVLSMVKMPLMCPKRAKLVNIVDERAMVNVPTRDPRIEPGRDSQRVMYNEPWN